MDMCLEIPVIPRSVDQKTKTASRALNLISLKNSLTAKFNSSK